MKETLDPLAPEAANGGTALLIIDMISCWDFPDGDKLLPEACRLAPRIAAFKKRCQRAGVPVIYANDNRGRWRSDFRSLVISAMASSDEAAKITAALQPDPVDYFVLKPQQSAFHATPLSLLLKHLAVHKLIIAGVSSDQCVMTTAAQARMLGLEICIPADLVASQTSARNQAALLHFSHVEKLKTTSSARLRLPGSRRAGH